MAPIFTDWRSQDFDTFIQQTLVKTGWRVRVANGVFDLLHPGHLHLLSQAKTANVIGAAPNFVLVALNSDASTRRLKPGRPIQPFEDRARMLAALRTVDAVVGFDEDTPLALLSTHNYAYVVKGDDVPPERVVRPAFLRVLSVPRLPEYSTTRLLARMASPDPCPVEQAWESVKDSGLVHASS